MRLLSMSLLLLLVVPATAATPPVPVLSETSPLFGAPGVPRFDAYAAPETLRNARNAGEPTIGIPWNTDHAFFQAFSSTYRVVFDDGNATDGVAKASWTDVSPAFTPINVDPMLHADHVTNRIWAGGLAGACSLMGMSDDDGRTWVPAGNICNFAQFDHQTIGSGPWANNVAPRGAAYGRATYYCSQLQIGTGAGNAPGTACSTSLNGGAAWLPPTEVLGGCGGLHGHVRVSEVTGTAVVPDKSCDTGESATGGVLTGGPERIGFGYTTDNGVTWNSRTIPGSSPGPEGGFDPSMDFSQQSGWLYAAQADELGIHVGMSRDEGRNFAVLGNLTPNAQPAQWLNLSSLFHDELGNPIKFAAFADTLAGDDLRAAVSFMATTDPAGKSPFRDCSDRGKTNIWHYYLAQTFDGGATWTVTRILDDPTQVGGIWDAGGGEPCRNLLDFMDMDMDSRGRLHISFADGCTEECSTKAQAGTAKPSDSRDSWGTILRQSTGRGLFAEHDVAAPVRDVPEQTVSTSSQPTPGLGFAGLAVAAVAALALRRRPA